MPISYKDAKKNFNSANKEFSNYLKKHTIKNSNGRLDSSYADLKNRDEIIKYINSSKYATQLKDIKSADDTVNYSINGEAIAKRYGGSTSKAGVDKRLSEIVMNASKLYETNLKNAESKKKNEEKKKKKEGEEQANPVDNTSNDAVATAESEKKLSEANPDKSGNGGTIFDKVSGAVKNFKGKANEFAGKLTLSNLLKKTGFADSPAMNKFTSGFNNIMNQAGLGNIKLDVGELADKLGNMALNAALQGLASIGMVEVYDYALTAIVIGLSYIGGDPTYKNCFYNVIMDCDLAWGLEWLDGREDADYDIDSTVSARGAIAARRGCHRVARYICRQWKDKMNAATDIETKTRYENKILDTFKKAVVYAYGDFSKIMLDKWFNDFDFIKPSILGTSDTYKNGKFKVTQSDLDIMAPIIRVKEITGGSAKKSSAKYGLNLKGKLGKDSFTEMKDYIDLRNVWAKHIYVMMTNNNGGNWTDDQLLTNELWHDRLANYPVLSEAQKLGTELFSKVMESDLVQFLSSVTVTNVYTVLELLKKTDFYFDVKRYSQRGVLNYYWGDLPEFKNYEKFTLKLYNNTSDEDETITMYEIDGVNTFTSKSEITLPSKLAVDYPNHKLIGWNTTRKGSATYAAGAKISINKNTILYAVWKEIKPDAGPKQLKIKGPEFTNVGKVVNLRTIPSVTATWSVDDSTKASINSDGQLTAIASADSVKITASASGYTSDEFEIKILPAGIKNLKFTNEKKYLRIGETLQLALNADIANIEFVIEEGGGEYISVSNDGIVTPISANKTGVTITAKKDGYSDATISIRILGSNEAAPDEDEPSDNPSEDTPEMPVEEDTGEVENNTTDEEIDETIDGIISDNIVYPDYFATLNATLDNFHVIMVTGLSDKEKQLELTNMYSNNSQMVLFSTKKLNSFNMTTTSFDVEQEFKLFTDLSSSNIDKLSNAEKQSLEYFLIAWYVAKNYSIKYTFEALKSLYGSTEIEYIYQTDIDNNFVLDEKGEKIVKYTTSESSFDLEYQEEINKFEDIIESLRSYFTTINVGNTYTLKFNLQGLGKDSTDITNVQNISIYTNISDYKPDDPSEEGFYFLGWAKDPEGFEYWDWDNDLIAKNTTLYAIWKEQDFYIRYLKLPKDKNPSLETDVYGTVNESEKKIHFYLKSAEKSDSGFYVDIVTSPQTASDVTSGDYYDIKNKQITIIDHTYDTIGKTKTYTVEVHTLTPGYSRVSYIVNGGYIKGENPNYMFPTGSSSLDIPQIKKRGYKCTLKTIDGKIFNYNTRIENLNVPVFAVYEKINIDIIYRDAGIGNNFSGQHESGAPRVTAYDKITYLDKPTKDKYVFLGYYTEQSCADDDDRITYIPKYVLDTDNIVLYAKWMDESEYNLYNNGIYLDGVLLDISKLQLFESFKFGEGDIWRVTDTGLVVFDSNGNKLDNITKNIAGSGYSPLGIGIFHGDTVDRITLVSMRNRSTNRSYLYYSYDNVNWIKLVDITNFPIKYYAGTGVEDVAALTFFEIVLFEEHYYSLSTDKKKIIYDKNENAVVTSIEDISRKYPQVLGHNILGLSITSSGIMYLLIDHIGVIQCVGFDIIVDGDNFSINPTISYIGVSGWLDDVFFVSRDVVGTPYNNVQGTPSVDMDFDIDDPEAVRQILDYYSNKTVDMYTYLNVETSAGGPDENFGNGETKDLEWLWNWPTVNGEIVNGATVYNRNNVRPSLMKRKQMVSMNRDASKTRIEYDVERTVDVETTREVVINQNNYNHYIGWTRVVGPNETEKITLEYLQANDILAGVEVRWNVKYSRSEITQTTIGDKTVDVYVGNDNYKQSKLFTKYLSKNKSNW